MNAYDIARILESNLTGCTTDRNGTAPTTGACVGIADSLVTDSFDVWATTLFVYDHPDVNWFGVWQDNETGFVYVDAVLVTTLEMAIAIGTERGEIAVWDIDTNTEIRL